MSKSNRIKGKFCSMVGCRITPEYREDELSSRKQGLTQAHKLVHSSRVNLEFTKTQRKALRALKKVTNNPDHPLQRKATLMERGHGIYMNLVSLLNKPEATRA